MTKPNWKPQKVKLGQIQAWDNNPRMSTKAQAQRIIASERKFGQPVPFLVAPEVDGRYLLYDGHQRLAAWFTVYGADYEMDAMVADRPLTEAEHKELIITLHTGATGSWDWNALSGWSAGDLQEWGMNGDALKGWNNDANNLKELLTAEVEPVDAEPQTDRAGELAEKWQTASGQLWKLGDHRLLIGDCTVRENVERLMGGERAEMCFTSPPYSDQREYTNDSDLSIEYLIKFLENEYVDLWIVNLGMSRKNGEINRYWDDYIHKAESVGMKLLSWNIWNREGLGGSVGNMTAMFPIEHEWVFVFGKSAKEINRTKKNKHGGEVGKSTIRQASGETTPNNWEINSSGKMGTVFYCDYERGKKDHPAMFPIEFSSAYIDACSNLGGLVYEPFAGSGTTIIAAHNLNRRCFAMEISEKYSAVILQRFLDATGIQPELVE